MVFSIGIKETQTIERDRIIWKTPRENIIQLIWLKLLSLFIKETPPIPIIVNGTVPCRLNRLLAVFEVK